MKNVRIEILKNGVSVRKFLCNEKDFQKMFDRAHNIAGGLWNGVDKFSIVSDYIK